MERDIDLNEVSDGKLYSSNDMVKADCNGCEGCSKCCHDMGKSLVLDPLDVYNISQSTNVSFEEYLKQGIFELNVVDGIILPNIAMSKDNGCAFLDENMRCTIHDKRPGFCRMFPLGRVYENNSFGYFLQVNECPYPNKTKVKIKKWLGVDSLKQYETFVNDWHYYLKKIQNKCRECTDDNEIKSISMNILNTFYLKGFGRDFYYEFYERLKA